MIGETTVALTPYVQTLFGETSILAAGDVLVVPLLNPADISGIFTFVWAS